MSIGRLKRRVIDDGDVNNNPGVHGAFTGAVRDHGAGGSCLRAAGLVLMRNAISSRANCCSGMGQGRMGTRHVCLGLI